MSMSKRGLGITGLGVIAALALVVIALAASGSLGGGRSPRSAAELDASRSRARLAEARAVVATLNRYQIDYSNTNLRDLARLFSAYATRHGFERNGCGTAHGRAQVLEQYAAQFMKNKRQRYFLLTLTDSAVAIDRPGQAQVNTTYEIPGLAHDTGPIGFTLVREGGHWSIAKVYATCHPSYPVDIPKAEPIVHSTVVASSEESPIVSIPRAE
jgi:hypothetical protein